MKLKPRVKQLWVEDLRTTTEGQIEGYLKTDEGYCCLGRLCELAVAEGVIPPSEYDETHGYLYDGHSAGLPDAVIAWAFEDPHREPLVNLPKRIQKQMTLSGLNDSGYTFPEIAGVVKVQL